MSPPSPSFVAPIKSRDILVPANPGPPGGKMADIRPTTLFSVPSGVHSSRSVVASGRAAGQNRSCRFMTRGYLARPSSASFTSVEPQAVRYYCVGPGRYFFFSISLHSLACPSIGFPVIHYSVNFMPFVAF